MFIISRENTFVKYFRKLFIIYFALIKAIRAVKNYAWLSL